MIQVGNQSPEMKPEPMVWLHRTGKDDVACGHFGGMPELPSDYEWPRHGETNLPLHFLGQIDLSRIPPLPSESRLQLPEQGFLYFFYDVEESYDFYNFETASKVLYSAHPGRSTAAPMDLPALGHEFGKPEPSGNYYSVNQDGEPSIRWFPAVQIGALVADSFESEEAYGSDAIRAQVAASILAVKDEGTSTIDPADHSAGFIPPIAAKPNQHFEIIRHQMLGAPVYVQNAARHFRKEGKSLLLQIASDGDVHPGFQWGDGGMIQFWIDPGDLRMCNFENAFAAWDG